MWLTVLLIVGVVAMVVGPIAAFRPSPRQKSIAALRTQAALNGLHVRLERDSYTHDNYAVYLLPWAEKPPENIQAFRLTKLSMNHELHFDGYWDWEGGNKAPNAFLNTLRSLLASLPDGISTLAVERHGFEVVWNERLAGHTPEQVICALKAWMEGARDSYLQS